MLVCTPVDHLNLSLLHHWPLDIHVVGLELLMAEMVELFAPYLRFVVFLLRLRHKKVDIDYESPIVVFLEPYHGGPVSYLVGRITSFLESSIGTACHLLL